MNRRSDEVEREDVESPVTMSQVHLGASGRGTDGEFASVAVVGRTQGAAANVALGAVQQARVLLSQQNVVGPTRFSLPKRVVLRMSRLFTHRLVATCQALADAVETLARVDRRAQDDVEQIGNSLQAQLVSVELASERALDALASSLLDTEHVSESATGRAVERFESTVSLLEGRLNELELERDRDRREIERLTALLGDRSSVQLSTPAVTVPGPVPGDMSVLDDTTYLEFERRFRGSPDVIRARQVDALRFVAPIVGSTAPLLDLGCGRGEWLAVLRDAGVKAYGVDASAGMVGDAQALGLDARCEDALAHLRSLDEGSIKGVSAFHFVEHVPLPFLAQVLDASFRAIAPGGVLLLETPNPTNLAVGAASFYLDPTHLRPVHPEFLAFLVESRGFTDVEIHYVHPVVEADALSGGEPEEIFGPRLRRVIEAAEWSFSGPQDYVVFARRSEAA
jgi:SAM-dependent methyltransferase